MFKPELLKPGLRAGATPRGDFIDDIRMDRRGFVLQSVRAGTGATLASVIGCDGGTGGPADGTYEAPWSSADYPNGADPAIETPVVYAAYTDDAAVRLWTEVLDTGTLTQHPQQQDHYISELRFTDPYGNIVAGQQFNYQNQARLISTTIYPQDVEAVYVYKNCSQHGWWREVISMDSLKLDPVGDLRRPFTDQKPGQWGDKILVHVPVFGVRPDGKQTIEVGDRAQQKLHEMIPTHYIGTVLVFDEYHQLRAGASVDPDYNPEPVIDFDPIGGTQYVRVVAYCNLHNWWEAVYKLY